MQGMTVTEGRDRAPLVDALRGFALLGVVASNMLIMLGAGAAGVAPSALDTTLEKILTYVVTGKFLALFSLLFGVSFGLYLRRSLANERPAAASFLRRMLALLLIGAANRAFYGTDIP